MNTSVTAKCIGCGAKRQIAAGEVLPGDHPHCEKCFMPMVAVGAMIATIETQALAQEWAEDPESMPEERREALLEHVRDRIDDMPRVLRSELGVPYTIDNVRGYAVIGLFFDLLLPLREAEELLEAASC